MFDKLRQKRCLNIHYNESPIAFYNWFVPTMNADTRREQPIESRLNFTVIYWYDSLLDLQCIQQYTYIHYAMYTCRYLNIHLMYNCGPSFS